MPPQLPRRGSRLAVATLALLAGSAAAANAAEPLAWIFSKDAANRYRTTQNIEATFDLGVGGKDVRAIRQVFDVTWTVREVAADGSARLSVTIDRIQMSITSAGGDAVEVDSSSTDEPQGFAAMIAPLLKTMAGAEIAVKMTSLGKVTNVQAPESMIEALRAAPGSELLGDLQSAEELAKLVAAASFELPKTLEPDARWKTTTQSRNPMLGEQTIETAFRYVGLKEANGKTYEAFEPTIEIKFANAEIAEQDASGEVLFDRAAGRLESMTLAHNLRFSTNAGGKPLDVRIEQSTSVERLPDEAQ